MHVKQKFEHKLIRKAMARYKYHEEIQQRDTDSDFFDRYTFFTEGKKFKKNLHHLEIVLRGIPNCNHIAAKNLLFQGKDECWKFFERTAQFYALSYFGASFPFIDPVAPLLNYALYVDRIDLVNILLSKANDDLERDLYRNNKEYIT